MTAETLGDMRNYPTKTGGVENAEEKHLTHTHRQQTNKHTLTGEPQHSKLRSHTPVGAQKMFHDQQRYYATTLTHAYEHTSGI